MSKFWGGLIAAVAVLSTLGTAHATVFNGSISFTANGFSVFGSGTAPVDPVIGSFNIAFDDSINYADGTTAGIELVSLNIALGSPLSFSYTASTGFLAIGGTSNGTGGIIYSPAENDFWLYINSFNTAFPVFQQLGYAQSSAGNNLYYTLNTDQGSITLGPPITAAVPEPATWAMMILGLAGVGLLSYRKTRSRAVARIAA